MKKVFLNGLVVAALVMTAAVVTSCKSKGGGEAGAAAGGLKLLERMEGEAMVVTFEYDEQNRIVSFGGGETGSFQTINYINRDMVTVVTKNIYEDGEDYNSETKFVRNGNAITVSVSNSPNLRRTITVNEDGYITNEEIDNGLGDHFHYSYSYQNGNLTGRYHEGVETEHKYDDKKSPFYNSNTPKWLIQYLLEHSDASQNNLVETISEGAIERAYGYEYDSDGFPVKRTGSHGTMTFTYRSTSASLSTSGSENLLSETEAVETASFSIDPQFNIYGLWEMVVYDPSTFLPVVAPRININHENTIGGIFDDDIGILTQTDTYQFSVKAEFNSELYTKFLIYDPATGLLKCTSEGLDNGYYRKKPDDYRPPEYFYHDVQLNDSTTLNFAVFYSELSDCDFFTHKIDSLRFAHNGKILSAHIDMSSQVFIGDNKPNSGLILLEDYNFDGHIDIAVLSSRGAANEVYEYFIYNPRTQSFHRNATLSKLMNATFDKEAKTVSSNNSSGAGRYYTGETYKWDGTELTLIRTESQAPNEDNVLIRTTRTLQNGEWAEQTDTVKMAEQ